MKYSTEFAKGFLFIDDLTEKKCYSVRLNNERGQSITKREFESSAKSHGFERACECFKKLAGRVDGL